MSNFAMLGYMANTERNNETEFNFILICSLNVTVLTTVKHINIKQKKQCT